MKKISLLLCFVAMAFFGFSQVKVVAPNGHTGVGPAFTTGGQSPTEKLDVDGNAVVRGSNFYVGTSTNTGYARIHVGKDRTGTGSAGFDFYRNTSANPSLNLAVAADGRTIFWNRENKDMIFRNTAANARVLFRTNDVVRMTVQANGNVDVAGAMTVNGGTAVTSDKRLKSNVKPFEKGLEIVMQMNPLTYTYNGEANTTTDREYVGIYAQDLQKIAPEFVSEFTYERTDGDSGEILETENFLKVHDSELKYLLVNAIKEQQSVIEAKDERITDLEERLAKLEEVVSAFATTEINLNNDKESFLGQNTPNPFGDKTVIAYALPTEFSSAKMVVTSVNGSVVKEVALNNSGSVEINNENFTSGVFNYSLVVDGKIVETKKMVISK